MKEKYVYVSFENSSAKYLYKYPSFKLRKGNIVLVETISGERAAIVVKIKKYFKENLQYKGKLSNILKIIDNNTFKNYRAYKNRLKGKVEKKWKHVSGFKKTKSRKYSAEYCYKNYAFIDTFYLKSDNSWIIDFKIKGGGCYTNDGIGKRQLKNTVYEIKVLLKNYTDGLIGKEEYLAECEKLSIYYSDFLPE